MPWNQEISKDIRDMLKYAIITIVRARLGRITDRELKNAVHVIKSYLHNYPDDVKDIDEELRNIT